jgi:hypothetical protein
MAQEDIPHPSLSQTGTVVNKSVDIFAQLREDPIKHSLDLGIPAWRSVLSKVQTSGRRLKPKESCMKLWIVLHFIFPQASHLTGGQYLTQ